MGRKEEEGHLGQGDVDRGGPGGCGQTGGLGLVSGTCTGSPLLSAHLRPGTGPAMGGLLCESTRQANFLSP